MNFQKAPQPVLQNVYPAYNSQAASSGIPNLLKSEQSIEKPQKGTSWFLVILLALFSFISGYIAAKLLPSFNMPKVSFAPRPTMQEDSDKPILSIIDRSRVFVNKGLETLKNGSNDE